MDYAGDVAIIGAGPVGMTLALALAQRDHSVVVLEQRARDELPQIKANHVSARSMELFRRLGVVGGVRRRGLPPDFPHDVCPSPRCSRRRPRL
jgi:2-polyprenyl-6-methoxyphenol hydroxylase-like FAD-dependent oxidoreductase